MSSPITDAPAEDLYAPIRVKLLAWWKGRRRSFPWRDTRNPYEVLIAEMMLRRTRAEQVEPVYREFIRKYPTVSSLASASEGDVAGALFSLGLAWRVPAFQGMARYVLEHHNGTIPSEKSALLRLPGVGDYVADAVVAFAFGKPAAVIDANTVRIIGRIAGFPVNDGSRRRRGVIEQIQSLVGRHRSRDMNLALLDLGALVCRPRIPHCGDCPLRADCITGRMLLGDVQDRRLQEHPDEQVAPGRVDRQVDA